MSKEDFDRVALRDLSAEETDNRSTLADWKLDGLKRILPIAEASQENKTFENVILLTLKEDGQTKKLLINPACFFTHDSSNGKSSLQSPQSPVEAFDLDADIQEYIVDLRDGADILAYEDPDDVPEYTLQDGDLYWDGYKMQRLEKPKAETENDPHYP